MALSKLQLPRIPGFVFVLCGVLVLGLAVQLTSSPDRDPVFAPTPAPATPQESALKSLQGRVFVHDLTKEEQARFVDAVDYRFPAGARVQPQIAFLVDFKPMSCGTIQPRGAGLRRYVYGNGTVVVDTDLSRSDFADFWTLCEVALGASAASSS